VDTIRVDICYRPPRIGWAIRSGDIESFRTAVRLSYAFWGGRFNPILNADREEESRQLIDLFRVHRRRTTPRKSDQVHWLRRRAGPRRVSTREARNLLHPNRLCQTGPRTADQPLKLRRRAGPQMLTTREASHRVHPRYLCRTVPRNEDQPLKLRRQVALQRVSTAEASNLRQSHSRSNIGILSTWLGGLRCNQHSVAGVLWQEGTEHLK
jgi:hypothetical protein